MYNMEVFPLKRQINQKIYALFEQLKLQLKDTEQHKQFIFPPGTDNSTGKISQGENYDSFPWVMLDFPKLFNKQEIFAFRTLFWYGHYFSFSLVLAGGVAAYFLPQIIKGRSILNGKGLFFTKFDDPWQHAITAENCLPVENVTDEQFAKHVKEYGFLKIAAKINSADPEEILTNAEKFYSIFLTLLSGGTYSDH